MARLRVSNRIHACLCVCAGCLQRDGRAHVVFLDLVDGLEQLLSNSSGLFSSAAGAPLCQV